MHLVPWCQEVSFIFLGMDGEITMMKPIMTTQYPHNSRSHMISLLCAIIGFDGEYYGEYNSNPYNFPSISHPLW